MLASPSALRRGVLAATIAVPFASAQTSTFDGTWWRQLSTDQKTMYVQGFAQGSTAAEDLWSGVQSTARPKLDPEVFSNAQRLTSYKSFTPKQLMDGVDTFYADSRNARLATSVALFIVHYRLGGAQPGELEGIVEAFRKKLAAPSPH